MTRSRTGSGSRESARWAPAQAVPDPSAAVNLPPRCAAVIRVYTGPYAGSRVGIRRGNPWVPTWTTQHSTDAGAVTLVQVKESRKIRGSDVSRAVDAVGDRTSTDLDGGDKRVDPRRADDEEAIAARRRYRNHGIEPIAPDPCIGALLEPAELVLACHRWVALDRHERTTVEAPSASVRGDLYVTTARLVHVGPQVDVVELDDIEDAALVGDRVLLVTRGGAGITVDTDRPRLLRVQMAAARVARASLARRRSGGPQLAAR